jgi:hypothetical protein
MGRGVDGNSVAGWAIAFAQALRVSGLLVVVILSKKIGLAAGSFKIAATTAILLSFITSARVQTTLSGKKTNLPAVVNSHKKRGKARLYNYF